MEKDDPAAKHYDDTTDDSAGPSPRDGAGTEASDKQTLAELIGVPPGKDVSTSLEAIPVPVTESALLASDTSQSASVESILSPSSDSGAPSPPLSQAPTEELGASPQPSADKSDVASDVDETTLRDDPPKSPKSPGFEAKTYAVPLDSPLKKKPVEAGASPSKAVAVKVKVAEVKDEAVEDEAGPSPPPISVEEAGASSPTQASPGASPAKKNLPAPLIALELAKECILDEEDLNLAKYLRMWRVVLRMLSCYNSLFTNVLTRIDAKICHLQYSVDRWPKYYGTMLKMSAYENRKRIFRNYKPDRSGTSTLIMLDNALQFVVDVLNKTYEAENPRASVARIAQTAYDEHISWFHTFWTSARAWTFIRWILPQKREFLKRFRGDMTPEQELEFHTNFEPACREISGRILAMKSLYRLTNYNPGKGY